MAITHVTKHSSPVSRGPLYDVFLSFRGPDTRIGFADCLYTMLTDAGFHVFRDEEDVEAGTEIRKELIEAIEQSKISIPVISRNYASSKSCLMELGKMLECMTNKNHIIIPIFYYVDLSDLRHSKGPFGRSLRMHNKRSRDDRFIYSSKSALRQITELKGHHLQKKKQVPHGKLIKQIVCQVQLKLKEDLNVTEHLVGVDPHVQDIMAKLKVNYYNGQAVEIGDTSAKVLAICGIPGVGKTLLAKYVYSQLYHLFDAFSSLVEVRAEINNSGVLSVQNKLISDLHKGHARKFDCSEKALRYIKNRFRTMKVLILLDDVTNHEQLSALVGELNWFGQGSRIIVTSQTNDVLGKINYAERYPLGLMEQDEALKLFCWHAFGRHFPHEKFKELSTEIVAATGRLPLALKMVGSSLFLVENENVWKETLAALQVAPDRRVQAVLENSYANLDENERKIFLDIACFFSGKDQRIPYYMWYDCKYSPSRSFLALRARSLVDIGKEEELRMHEILKDFGQEIVKNENQHEPGKRSRLCNHEDALHVLERRKGTENVEALQLEFGDRSEEKNTFECDQFDRLDNLRFLKLDRAIIRGNFGNRLSSLRWLDWQGCHKIFDFQSLNLNLENLVILDLSWSQVDKDWRGWELLEKARKLKVLKLTGCVQLIATPKFHASMELERLILESCSQLLVIHPSVGNLKKLVSLNMKQCSGLFKLPNLGHMTVLNELLLDGTAILHIDFQEGSMRKLETLSARDCKSLTQISDSIRYLKSLRYLALDGTAINTLRESIESLEKLQTLSLKNCRKLSNLPNRIGKLRSLQFLDLSDTLIQNLPPSITDLKEMKVLRMRGTFIQKFPEAILNLEKLEEIDFSFCRSLKGRIHRAIGRLSSLAILNLSHTQISRLPASFSRPSCLQKLDISGCDNLRKQPKFPSSLIIVS